MTGLFVSADGQKIDLSCITRGQTLLARHGDINSRERANLNREMRQGS